MKRIPEDELMDDVEQAEAYAEADFSEPHNAFVEHFKTRFPDFLNGNVLDLGCGTADITLRFAKAFPETVITGIDGARAMLDIGIQEVKRQGFSARIKLEKRRVPDAGLSCRRFDAIISNSLLHHLDNPLVIWETIKQCSKLGAPILVMDLLRPVSLEDARRLVQKYAADASPILQKDFFNSLLAAYTVPEIKRQLTEVQLDYLTIEIVSDRHMIVWGVQSFNG